MLKERNPLYHDILDFYGRIIEAQKCINPDLRVAPVEIDYKSKSLQFKEGFPLLDRKDFFLDIPSSVKLFESICRIAKISNVKMRENVQAIEEALAINALNLREILKSHYDDSFTDAIAEEFDIDKGILKFLIGMSVLPSLKANAEKLRDSIDLEDWQRGYCPVCGSSPEMSEINGEGQRYFLCSFCGFRWPGERLKCPFCENREQGKLHYFYEENREAYRVDLCDNCGRYIKTVDSRKLDYTPDLILEDITTTHLDILALERGYRRPAIFRQRIPRDPISPKNAIHGTN